MQAAFGPDTVLSVVASNRPQSRGIVSRSTAVHPAKTSGERQAFIGQLKAAEADAFICFSYSMILDSEILAIPRLGAINIHGGLLPSHRGANILNWVIIEGAATSGVTAHYMTTAIDEGDIIFQSSTAVLDEDTAVTLKTRLDALGSEMLMRIRADLNAGKTLPRVPQDPAKARYYPRRKADDGRIDWTLMSDRDVYNLIRALVNPWPGAFCITATGERVVFDRYYTLGEVATLRTKYGR
jgi:methionyl-tRNA formyltransferase